MRVLLVDDNPAYLLGCLIVLMHAGHQVVGCGSFEQARRYMDQGAFDVLITDVRLGAYNGLQLVIRAPSTTMKIAMSAFGDPALRREAAQAGARFVEKPSDCTALAALLTPA